MRTMNEGYQRSRQHQFNILFPQNSPDFPSVSETASKPPAERLWPLPDISLKMGFISKRKNRIKANAKSINEKAMMMQDEINKMTNNDEWLSRLYEYYTARFLSDNCRIWKTGSIMIPLSFAPLAILPSIPSPQLIHYVILGLASIVIYIVWLLIADNHRAFQNKSMPWIKAIENTIDLVNTSGCTLYEYMLTKLITARWMRRVILMTIVLLWVTAALW